MTLRGGHTDRRTDTHIPMCEPKQFQETSCTPGLKRGIGPSEKVCKQVRDQKVWKQVKDGAQ